MRDVKWEVEVVALGSPGSLKVNRVCEDLR